MSGPLVGIRVLDLTHVLAGPYCAYQLALLGADVIKIEPPTLPDCARGRGPDAALNALGMGLNYQVQASNKRALALDLKHHRGQAVLHRLADSADVIVENYRVGALAALGLGADVLRARKPTLIYCSITGFGQIGERSSVNGYDNVIQAASGLMVRTGSLEEPLKVGASVVDYFTGMTAAFAIAAALFRRERCGLGETIDCAMFDSALALMAPEMAETLHDGPHALRPAEAGLGTYRTAGSDEYLTIGVFTPAQNRILWTALGREDFARLAEWTELWAAAESMRVALSEILRARSAVDWEEWFHDLGLPAERVRTLSEAARFTHLTERGFLHNSAGVNLPLAPFRYAGDGPKITSPAPRVGEHSASVLEEAGYTADEIASFRSNGVIG